MPSADAKSGKKELQYKEVLSHSLSKGSCLLFAKLSKVVKENALSGIGVSNAPLSRETILLKKTLHPEHPDF